MIIRLTEIVKSCMLRFFLKIVSILIFYIEPSKRDFVKKLIIIKIKDCLWQVFSSGRNQRRNKIDNGNWERVIATT